MKKHDFKQSNADHTLFLKHREGMVTALIIYVDDMIITVNDEQEITNLREYLAIEFEMKNLEGLKYFLGTQEIGKSSKSSMNIFCDNKSAIQIAENPVQHDRTKHVEVDQHFIKEKLEAMIIRFLFVKSEEQLADILTKLVPRKVFYNSLDKLDIRDINAST
ncbi:hypothetical protein RJ639_018619 [Escallonia herrerae]|uniref:Reverse transcriptase Ty1/copia-type domain-containing protein n=1 Tax=Escallonia herrerae TaxID=1293975 RepID=A0AA88V9U5_9ASTE|nr:hypothetical protein RJ639_018619 [Escallonia herrerae]